MILADDTRQIEFSQYFGFHFFFHKGEMSSGKSSVINGILGERILPTGIMATTTRVCRIKYSKELLVTFRDQTDKKDIKQISFKSLEEMADKLKTIATWRMDNTEIGFVDIYMPFLFQQVQLIVCDFYTY